MSRPPQIPGYQYVADIAIGGYSVVYRYRQRSPRRDVAVKVLSEFEGNATGPGGSEQRDAEADMMATLGNHPNIVQVIVADVAPDGRHYIIMPYYPGASLAELAARGPLAVGKVLRVGVQIAGALDAAHRLGLLHRDIKPANVLIDEYGTPRLTDFGIAGWVGQRAVAEGMSLPWSPPEVVAGGESRRASDVYALGATLFHLLTGSPPHARQGDTRAALEQRVQSDEAPPTGRADVPVALERLLARMLSRTPPDRPDSASLVAAELREIEDALGGPAPADAPWHSGPGAAELPPRFVATERRDRPLVTPAAPSGPSAPAGSSPTGTGYPAPPTTRPGDPSPAWPGTATPSPAWPAPGTPTPAWPGAADGRTHRRDPDDHHTSTIPAPDGRADGRTRVSQWVLIGAATVAFAVLAVGIVLAAKGSPPARPNTPANAGSSQNAALDELPPGAVAISAKRAGGKLTFRWTYDGAQAGDTFLWRVSGRTAEVAATAPAVSLADPPGTQLCIQVKVVRSNGNGSPDWSPEGCGS